MLLEIAGNTLQKFLASRSAARILKHVIFLFQICLFNYYFMERHSAMLYLALSLKVAGL